MCYTDIIEINRIKEAIEKEDGVVEYTITPLETIEGDPL